jgi:hypothetical protein
MAAAAGQQQQQEQQQAAAQADQSQWRVTWTDVGEPPEQDVVQKFRRAWAIAVSPARIERDPAWDYMAEGVVWGLFSDPAVQEAVIATHPDGRTVTLARM